jgi:hypothetical protein
MAPKDMKKMTMITKSRIVLLNCYTFWIGEHDTSLSRVDARVLENIRG